MSAAAAVREPPFVLIRGRLQLIFSYDKQFALNMSPNLQNIKI